MRFAYVFDVQDGHQSERLARISGIFQGAPVVESRDMETTRPRWHRLLGSLRPGDELVLYKFSNALRGLPELSLFLELCRSKNIRVISVADSFDTASQTYPGKSQDDFVNLLSSFPKETSEIRERSRVSAPDTSRTLTPKSERHRKIINMYNSKFSISEIIAAAGVSGPAVIYQTLARYGIPLRRELNKPQVRKLPSKPADMHAMVIDEFKKGRSIPELMSLTGYARTTISLILKGGGCTRPRELTQRRHDKVLEMYSRGLNVQEISLGTGYNSTYVWRLLHRLGALPSRPSDHNV